MNIKLQPFKTYAFSSRIVQHSLFWSIVLIIEIFTFTEEYSVGLATPRAIHYHILKLVIIAMATYFNYLLLIPSFFKQRKYLPYILLNVVNLAFFSFLVFEATVYSLKKGDIHIGGLFEHHIIYTLSVLYVAFFIIASTLFYFIQEWYKLKDIANSLSVAEKEKTESEHHALKAQLNPHFLFNTLNNIYALSLIKSDDTPQSILKLSGLMSYILYECKENEVPVQKEIDFLNNYIELEKIRSKKLKVDFAVEIKDLNFKITPLLFIPFVENAFKHSKGISDNSFIKIRLHKKEKNNLIFYCENKKGTENIPVNNQYHGIGIENVKKRLDLLYKNKHQLKISDKDSQFKVELSLKLT
jgi:two-component system, LytTR family, sensor kinase